ncbi:MAG TPA: Mur ligase family protein, partial [Patescibacteria group bacterium]|nr:Mur ligase family protein [Patescibacteria group bacterium]
MKIAIVGYGREGQSSYKYFSRDSLNDITICDIDPNITVPNVKTQTGDKYLDNLNEFDLIIRSSGINPKLILNKNPLVKDKITTQLNIFLKRSKSKNIIGITGTKGKGTTSTLIHKILTESGYHSILAGNLGIPFLDVIDKINPETYVVIELSSFQLDDLKEKSPHISLCLMISEDHINWHGNFNNYLRAKSNLFKNQNESDIAIYLSNNKYSKKIANYSPANKKIPYMSSHGANIE